MTQTADVVVIGAGVQGLSAAYNTALGGTKRIVVVETHERPGRGSSGRSGSMLMKSRENRPKIALSLYSYERFMDFEDEFSEPFRFRKTGFINAVSDSLAVRYRNEHELRLSMGAPSEILAPDAIREVAPGVEVDDLAFGVLGPDDGEIDATQILDAYERRGRQLGVTYLFEQRATGLDVESESAVRVETTRGPISCGAVVNAAGADASEVGSWIDCVLPITNCLRSLFFGSTADPAFLSGPMVEDAEMEWYFRALGGGRVLVGMGKEVGQLPGDHPNLEALPAVRAGAMRRAPGLADFNVTGGSSGIRPLTPDILPIVGPLSGMPNVVNSCGWGGEGIMHSPAGGALVADWLNGTATCPIDPTAFLFERFSQHHRKGATGAC